MLKATLLSIILSISCQIPGSYCDPYSYTDQIPQCPPGSQPASDWSSCICEPSFCPVPKCENGFDLTTVGHSSNVFPDCCDTYECSLTVNSCPDGSFFDSDGQSCVCFPCQPPPCCSGELHTIVEGTGTPPSCCGTYECRNIVSCPPGILPDGSGNCIYDGDSHFEKPLERSTLDTWINKVVSKIRQFIEERIACSKKVLVNALGDCYTIVDDGKHISDSVVSIFKDVRTLLLAPFQFFKNCRNPFSKKCIEGSWESVKTSLRAIRDVLIQDRRIVANTTKFVFDIFRCRGDLNPRSTIKIAGDLLSKCVLNYKQLNLIF